LHHHSLRSDALKHAQRIVAHWDRRPGTFGRKT
jgi:hypothetical protein